MLLLSTSCALLGGLVGAGMVLWLAPRAEPGAVVTGRERPVASGEGAAADATLLTRRVEQLERVVRTLQATGATAAESPSGQRGAAPDLPAAVSGAAEPSPLPASASDPVFEAAVLDVLERAQDDRDSEREVRRSERARGQAEHWTHQLTEQLSLSPEQASKALEIRAALAADLRELSRANDDGEFVPRERRREERRALRERAERALRELLQPEQAARYDQLPAELQIVRPTDVD